MIKIARITENPYRLEEDSHNREYLDEMKQIKFSNGDKVCAIGQGTWNMGRNPLYEKTEAKALFLNKEMFVAGSTYWNIVYGRLPGEALKDEEGVANMRNLGRNIAWLLNRMHESDT